MRTFRKTALAAAAIATSGVVGGLTYAAVSTPAAASTAAVADTVAAHGAHRWLGRLEHGEVTVQTRRGDRTIDLQRGAVTAVSSSSVTVRSHDGFTASYAVRPQTRVRTSSGLTSVSAVHTGDKVLVVATGGNALRIRDR